MITDDFECLSAAYVVDAVDDVERALFEGHLTGCTQCRAEVASLRAASTELSSLTQTFPPESLRANVLRDISAYRPLPPRMTSDAGAVFEQVAPSDSSVLPMPTDLDSKRTQRARMAPLMRNWMAGVAAAALLATGGLSWHPWSPDRSPVQLTSIQQVLQAKDIQRFETRIGRATVTIARSASLNKAVIMTVNLPDAPQGKVYELWLQQGETMVKAGFIPWGPSNATTLRGNVATAVAAGITIEPTGGSLMPTTAQLAQISFV